MSNEEGAPEQPKNPPDGKINRTPLSETMRDSLEEAIKKLSGALDARPEEIESADMNRPLVASNFERTYWLSDGRHAEVSVVARRLPDGAIQYAEPHILITQNRGDNTTHDTWIRFRDNEFYIRRDIAVKDQSDPALGMLARTALLKGTLSDEDWRKFEIEGKIKKSVRKMTEEELSEEEAVELIKDFSEARRA